MMIKSFDKIPLQSLTSNKDSRHYRQSIHLLHIILYKLVLQIRILLLNQYLKGPTHRLMIWLVAIYIPIFNDHDLLIVLGVEEDAITPWWGALGVVDLLFLYVFVGGQEVDCALFVHGEDAAFVRQVVFVFLE